jgi:hypothetical protein
MGRGATHSAPFFRALRQRLIDCETECYDVEDSPVDYFDAGALIP